MNSFEQRRLILEAIFMIEIELDKETDILFKKRIKSCLSFLNTTLCDLNRSIYDKK